MNEHRPIGIFDSGVGGLSVAREIHKQLPNEDLLYIADSQYAPYGEKSSSVIEQRAATISEYLIKNNIKALVVACNTATAFAIQNLRTIYSLPIVGMEPALKPAVEKTKSGVVGIIATTRTLQSEKFNSLNTKFKSNVHIIAQACPGLVEQVELGDFSSRKTKDLVNCYVKRLLDKGVDTIVLGCSHYPFLSPLIQQCAGSNILVIDTGVAVTNELARQLKKSELLMTQQRRGILKFVSSKVNFDASSVISKLWGKPLEITILPEKYIDL